MLKYIKITLGIITILIVGFLALGIIKPTVTYECAIMVEKPIEESWAVLQDTAKLSDWLPGFQKIEHISGTPGTVGAVSNVYFDNNGESMSILETITDMTPNESIAMKYASDFMDMDYKLDITLENGQSKIYSSTLAKGNGMISKSIMALMGGSLKKQEETNLANLKKTIEENTINYFQSEQ